MKTAIAAKAAPTNTYELVTAVCRKISTKSDEEDAKFLTYVGQAPITSFINLPEDENVRSFIPGSGSINRSTEVHKAIGESLRERPQTFSALNGGIVIVASAIEMLDDQKRIRLTNPSIINGSQTRGEIRNYIASLDEGQTASVNVKFEIVVTTDEDLIADISIARNFQIKVQAVSIYGKKGYFDELAKAFNDKRGSNRKLRTSETDRDESFIPTEKLIQVITALVPEKLWSLTGKSGEYWNKAFAYSSAQGPLKLYGQNYEKVKKNDPNAIILNQFYHDIASEAWELYEKWVVHPGFNGSGLKSGYGVERDSKGKIIRIYDGIIFPILAAFAVFVDYKNGKWTISPPSNWRDDFLIEQAKRLFTSKDVSSNPQTMGKMSSSYSSLNAMTSMATNMMN